MDSGGTPKRHFCRYLGADYPWFWQLPENKNHQEELIMDYYLLFFGIVVLILFLAGVFFTISEFNEMSDHPDDYRKSQDKVKIK